MSLTSEEIKAKFPLHWLVWHNQEEELDNELATASPEQLEQRDPRGRTPLLLAIALGRAALVGRLVDAGADVDCERDGWTAVQEATVSGDAQLLARVLSERDYRRQRARSTAVPELLQRLSRTPDFYVEMKWEFTSWVPLVSRMCPSDTYRVYKRGASVRVDASLAGLEGGRWRRGERSYIFTPDDSAAALTEVQHEARAWWRERVGGHVTRRAPSARSLQRRLRAPVAATAADTKQIQFERNKSGVWGWRADKREAVSGYSCAVFACAGAALVSRSRWEHVPDPRAAAAAAAAAGGLLGAEDAPPVPEAAPQPPAPPPSLEEYFAGAGDVGRAPLVTEKTQRFRANLWLCEDYPLQLQEQVVPILDLMSSAASPHFAKLKDFIQLQLPAGFPVKIEIPLFHVMHARVTFANIHAAAAPAPHVTAVRGEAGLTCRVDDDAFRIPDGYKDAAAAARSYADDDEEDFLQYAIEQSLMEAGTHEDQVDVWEALRGARPAPAPAPAPASPDAELQRAIEDSLRLNPPAALEHERDSHERDCHERDCHGRDCHGRDSRERDCHDGGPHDTEDEDESADLAAALALSAREHARLERERLEDERALGEAIRLSLVDN